MSHFIREFETLVREKTAETPNSIWTIAGMDRSMLSRIRNGDERQSNIQFEDIPRVAAAIGAEEMIYLRLLRARLLDQCLADKRAARIVIEISGSKVSGGPQASALHDAPLLPAHYETAIMNIIAGMKTDSGLRDTILWLGNEVFAKPLPQAKPVKYSNKKPTRKKLPTLPEQDPEKVLQELRPPKRPKAANE